MARIRLSKKAFAEWVGKQPEQCWYNFHDAKACALGQYLKAIGRKEYSLASERIPMSLLKPLGSEPWTFGSLAARLRASPPR